MVATAIEEIAEGGYEQLTIRSLAARLGVAPMSLYRHIRDKDDLLDEVVERLLVGAWEPSSPTEDWRAWVTEAADKLRAPARRRTGSPLRLPPPPRRLTGGDRAYESHHGGPAPSWAR